MHRRHFLRRTAGVTLPLLAGPSLVRAADPPAASSEAAFPGLIVRQSEPTNLEFPFATLDRFLTPTERFYVRNHFAVPKLDPKAYRLKVDGAVERPLDLSLADLLQLPQRTRAVLLECAGNGRVFLTPKAKGVGWALGAVGNAEWTGVPLAAVLERAGVKAKAVEVVLEGADKGTVEDSPGAISFARSLPIAEARGASVLLAQRMNGQALPAAHGAPLRAVVAGWYGMASVKWLTRILVVERPFRGFWQSIDYATFERVEGLPTLRPITRLEVKASIARPAIAEVVSAGKAYRVHGAAWAGSAEIAKVEVSTDDGQTWVPARLLDQSVPFAWRLWDYTWSVPARPGRVTLRARATDSEGRTQPVRHDTDRRNYMVNFVLPVAVEVR